MQFCYLIDGALTFEATIHDRETGKIRRKITIGQFLHSLPQDTEYAISDRRFHWRLEICPRTSIPVGF